MSKSQLAVYILNGGNDYKVMFLEHGWAIAKEPEEADLIQFCGGADVSPELYDQAKHPSTYCQPERDMAEEVVYHMALAKDIPMAGICRGGQFLNVMCGGGMYQHVDGHAKGANHYLVDTDTGQRYSVSSTHHQMMIAGDGGEVRAVANEAVSKGYMDGDKEVINRDTGNDTEVVLYPEFSCLCFQPHPEFFDSDNECQVYYFELIEELMG